MINIAPGEDFETKLEKVLSGETLIKIEPERIALFISRRDGTREKLIWGKSE
ncbi:MAG TPA: hypothetical protein G4O06_06870 [Dehalococcoidia bacterium]|nr:hypothetical protein [Dehalococcoidia bacterium]